MDRAAPTSNLAPWLVAAAAATAIGWLDYHASEDVQVVVLALLLAGAGLGFWRPRWVWLTALLLWAAIPVAEVLRNVTHHHPGHTHPEPLYQTVIALVPTLAAAAAGAGLRWVGWHRAA